MISQNLQLLRNEITKTTKHCGRSTDSVKLIAVSKTKPASDIIAAHNEGQIDFGENYIQEWREKSSELKSLSPLHWHIIGPVQSNKLKYIAGEVHLIHTMDHLDLIQGLDSLCQRKQTHQDILIQVKISAEDSKSGCMPHDISTLLSKLNDLSHVHVKGLMTIGSLTDDINITRSEYSTLRKLRDELNQTAIYRAPLSELSMGMSSDFVVAIEEGATLIRIGSQIFGARESKG